MLSWRAEVDMLIPGIVSVTFRSKPFEAVIDLALQAGLRGIEWSEGWHIGEDDPSKARQVGQRTRENGLSVVEYGSYYRLGENMDFHSRLRNAEALGADTIRIWGGSVPSAELDGNQYRALVDEARRVASDAASAGMTVVMEWHRRTVMDSNESGRRFIDDVAAENLRTLWQPLQMLGQKEREEGLAALGSCVGNIHVFHWVDEERLPLRDGLDAWRGYLANLDPAPSRYLLLEFVRDDSGKQLMEDSASLLDLIACSEKAH